MASTLESSARFQLELQDVDQTVRLLPKIMLRLRNAMKIVCSQMDCVKSPGGAGHANIFPQLRLGAP